MDKTQKKYLLIGGAAVAALLVSCCGLGVVGLMLSPPATSTGQGVDEPGREVREAKEPSGPKSAPAGPGEKLTEENYGRIRPGMRAAEVTAILGSDPVNVYRSKTDPRTVGMTWRSGERSIAVTFEDGKALGKSKVGF